MNAAASTPALCSVSAIFSSCFCGHASRRKNLHKDRRGSSIYTDSQNICSQLRVLQAQQKDLRRERNEIGSELDRALGLLDDRERRLRDAEKRVAAAAAAGASGGDGGGAAAGRGLHSTAALGTPAAFQELSNKVLPHIFAVCQ